MKVCPECQEEYADDVDFCPSDGTKLRSKRNETDDPLLGRALDGRWVIESKLGEGGMGAVYKGHQKSVSRTVAIKTLRPALVDSEEFVDRFFREAKIAANIAHPHCVTILDYGEGEDGTLYLAMEFLEGELLTDRLDGGDLTVKEVFDVGIQVASALSAAHEQQIVHRDLKPDNIFLLEVPGGATFVKVLDFGIAKMLNANTQVTKTGMIFGTPEYMSPEQCRGTQIDGRSDLYALGCILYELVGGRTPFSATTPMAVLMAHVNQEAPSLGSGETGPNVPPGLDRIIMKLLEKDPDDRYPSAAAVREALEAELQRVDNPSTPVTAPRQIVAPEVNIGFDDTVGFDTGEQSEAPAEPRPPTGATKTNGPATRSNRGLLIVLGVLVAGIAAVSVAAVMLLRGPDAANATPGTSEPTAQLPAPPDESAPLAAEAAIPSEEEAVEAPDDPETSGDGQTAVAASDAEEKTRHEESDEQLPTPKKKKAKRKKPKRRAEPDSSESEAFVAAEPTAEPAPEPAPEPDPEPTVDDADRDQPEEPKKKKKKRKKRLDQKIDDAVEDEVKSVGESIKKGADRTVEKALDGLIK